MKNYVLLMISLFFSLGIIAIYNNQSKKMQNLIPRKVLFGNPEKAAARISPDGKFISYLAPVNNVLNIFVGYLDNTGITNTQQVTFDSDRGIRNYIWSPDSRKILYVQDKGGDENWLLYGVDLETKTTRCYTSFDNVQVRIIAVDKNHPEFILIGINKDNPEEHDLYKLFLEDGKIDLISKNLGKVVDYLVDKEMNVKGLLQISMDSGRKLLIEKDGEWKPAVEWGLDDANTSGPLFFALDTNYIYLKDSRKVNAARLVRLDLGTGKLESIVEDQDFDVGSVFFDDDTRAPLAVTVDKERSEWVMLDAEFEKDFNTMRMLDEGELHIVSTDNAREKYVIAFEKDDGPISYYLYDAANNESIFLFDSRSDLKKYSLSSMEPINFKSRDGFTIYGYLTLPPNKKPENLPLVLNVHGGPWVRDSWGYNSETQWLANRGYAVLQINYRGSSGFGKAFLNAGNKEWGGNMHNDLIDGVSWAIEKGIAHPKKIAIFGASYGGYAALVGATFTPEVFCCAVDVVGVSNLLTFMDTIPPYWEPFRQDMYRRIGDPENEREFLRSRSPLFFVDNIKIPLLIAQGANDPRVNRAESEQIVEALKKKGLDYKYLLFDDEGHGFAKPENRLTFYREAEKFLAKHLGGYCER